MATAAPTKRGRQGSTSLYDFYFVYSDGSYYYGTVSDNGSYGYYIGETITTSHTYGGYYYISADAGTTSRALGSVQTTDYYDATSGKSYTPYYDALGETDGSSGSARNSTTPSGPTATSTTATAAPTKRNRGAPPRSTTSNSSTKTAATISDGRRPRH